MNVPVIYVVTRNSNGLYKSTDEGATFVQVTTNALTSEVTDIAIADREFTNSVILYGDGAATTPYYSFDDGQTYQAGQNAVGKEVTYVGQNTYVFGSTNSASGSGAAMKMSFDEGISVGATIDVRPLFNYPGAVYNNITITGFDFPNSAGGYITVAGDQNNASADQILTRTYDRGASFPDALILPGSLGIIRGVWVSPERNIVFAIGEPDTIRGALYSINPSLTEAPVKILDGITIGSITNDLTVKFASVPSTYNLDPTGAALSNTYIDFRSRVYFLDSAGKLYYSDDYGFTWEYRSTIPGQCIDIIAISENTVLVLSKSPTSVFKSVDGGFTFIESPQPGWTNPKGMAFTFANDCGECNAVSEVIVGNSPIQCIIEDRSVGTLCKAPYVYSEALGACAKPSTIVPTNLILSLDYSGSVSSEEGLLFRSYMKLLVSKVEDRLLDGSMQIAIIGWSSNACLQQSFTNDINLLYTAIDTNPPGVCNDALTNHTEEMCLSIRTMYEQSVLRPNAENVLVVFTDSGDNFSKTASPTGIRSCDLSDIGLFPVVPEEPDNVNSNWSNNPLNMYELVKNAKTSLNGVGMKMMTVSLGTLNERSSCKNFFIDYPKLSVGLGPSYILPSTVPNTSNFYYFDGGSFDTAEFIADQIRLGLAAEIVSSPECPEGCVGRPGLDGLGYCYCNEDYLATQCTYELVNCDTNEVVVVKPAVKSWVGKVVKLFPRAFSNVDPFFYDGGTGCWEVQETGIFDPNYFDVRINTQEVYDTCLACGNPPWYRLTDCLDNRFIIYTKNTDFQSYIDSNEAFVTLINYPGRCFYIEVIDGSEDHEESNITISDVSLSVEKCTNCPRTAAVFILTNCEDSSSVIYSTTSELQNYVNAVITIDTFGSRCWLVEIFEGTPTIIQDIRVVNGFNDCAECRPPAIYEFVSCDNQNVILYTQTDFSEYVGKFVNLQEYPGNCFACKIAVGNPTPIQNLTINGEPYSDCESCLVTYYQLTNCANPNVILISTSTELSRYLGKTITAAGYTGLCFSVTQPQCDCIKLVIDGIEYNVNAEANLYNGKKIYLFQNEAGIPLGLGWNTNPDRWELFNPQTLETYGFSTLANDCPFSNFWTIQQGSPYIITSVTFCVDEIYNIAPELEFTDCTPCINCI